MTEQEQRVTPLELFFDLVFVFAITQVTGAMSSDPTWTGLGRGLLVLAALWWAWAAYAWLTNTLEPEDVPVRLAMFAAMAAMLAVGLAVPHAFGRDGALFGLAYLAVRVIHVGLYAIAGKGDPDLLGAVLRFAPTATIGPAMILAAALVDGPGRAALWGAALAIDYGGALVGRGQGWRVSPAHFAERHGLVVIIALGESVVAIGVGATGLRLDGPLIVASMLGVVVVACLWWAYFDAFSIYAKRRLEEVRGQARARFARDYYSYLHLPMIAGVVLFALGLKKTLEHVEAALDAVPAAALSGGLGLYFVAHVALRVRLVFSVRHAGPERPPWLGRGRPVVSVALMAMIPVAGTVPALTALAIAALVCCSLIGYDVVHYREERARIRLER